MVTHFTPWIRYSKHTQKTDTLSNDWKFKLQCLLSHVLYLLFLMGVKKTCYKLISSQARLKASFLPPPKPYEQVKSIWNQIMQID